LKGSFLAESIDGIRADAQALLHLALNRLARSQDGLQLQAGEGFERIEPLRGKEAAGGDLNRSIVAFEREDLFLQ
jgi:hypothetical protein